MRVVVAIALHRRCPLPEDPLYLPVQAGSAIHPRIDGTVRDDPDGSISERNMLYSELTVHHYLWKQIDAEAFGLCHYRRYFTRRPFGRNAAQALTAPQAEELLTNADVILPRPRLYMIETNYSHYAHAHRVSDLDLARTVIADICPDYLPAFDRVMNRRHGHRFNMFIMRREPFRAYSAWLFGLLFEMEKRMGTDAPDRVFGYLAERLMDVWLAKEQPRVKELRVLHTEGQNWPRKIAGFLLRKLRGGHAKRPECKN